MYVVTFYSYQGGVGRTTALVNVAADLAMRGRKVLVVDFDLAKPALSSLGPLHPNTASMALQALRVTEALSCLGPLRPNTPRPGVVEFIAEYLHLDKSPAVEEYVYQTNIMEEADCPVWVMPAGRRDDSYWTALARLDWQNLFAVRDGFLFLEDLKSQWRDVLKVDYVLIDAASGVTDTTGICTRQLADDVVFLIVSDGSDQAGTERVMEGVFKESIADGPRRIDIHLVTSKVPDLDGDELPGARQLDAILEPNWTTSPTTGVHIMFELTAELPFDPVLLQGRQVVMSRRPGSRLAQQYRSLANALIEGNCTQDREGAKAFLKVLQLHPYWVVGVADQYGETVDRWDDCTHRLEQIIDHFTAERDAHGRLLVDPVTAVRDAEVLGQAASCLFRARSRMSALDILGTALEQAPGVPSLLWQRASYRRTLGDPRFVDDLMILLEPPADQAPTLPRLRTSAGRLLLPPHAAALFDPLDLPGDQRLPRLDTEPLCDDVLPLEKVPGIDTYVVSAIRLLHREAPERLEEALQKSQVRKLSQAHRDQLLSEELPDSAYPDQTPEWLIQWHHFREVINRLGPEVQGASEPDPIAAVHLAMAYWAVGDEAEATRISQEALKPWWPSEDLLQRFQARKLSEEFLVLLQMFTLLAFRADDLEAATKLIKLLLGELGDQLQGIHFFSYWRYREVTFSQFRADCRDLKQMIEQQKIRKQKPDAPLSLPAFFSFLRM